MRRVPVHRKGLFVVVPSWVLHPVQVKEWALHPTVETPGYTAHAHCYVSQWVLHHGKVSGHAFLNKSASGV